MPTTPNGLRFTVRKVTPGIKYWHVRATNPNGSVSRIGSVSYSDEQSCWFAFSLNPAHDGQVCPRFDTRKAAVDWLDEHKPYTWADEDETQ